MSSETRPPKAQKPAREAHNPASLIERKSFWVFKPVFGVWAAWLSRGLSLPVVFSLCKLALGRVTPQTTPTRRFRSCFFCPRENSWAAVKVPRARRPALPLAGSRRVRGRARSRRGRERPRPPLWPAGGRAGEQAVCAAAMGKLLALALAGIAAAFLAGRFVAFR